MGQETASYEAGNGDEAPTPAGLGLLWVAPSIGYVRLQDAMVVGRDDGCDIHLPSAQVSRRHATIRKDGPLWLLEDRRSKNGTWVNAIRSDVFSLKAQDTVRIGNWVAVACAMRDEAIEHGQMFEPLSPDLLVSAPTRAALGALPAIAARELPIVIYGETGTGKDALARAIHGWSGRAGPIVGVNCAAIPEAMAEALLFGHRKGAFTGADAASEGYVRAADRGTLFLDEIADLPLPIQGKLLRALEERAVTPLGATRNIEVNFRIVAACQNPLDALVEEGSFRRDLHARLRGLEVTLPPLRQRRQEIIPLLRHFLRGQGTEPELDPRLVEALCVYDWPYNVREVQQLGALLAAPGRVGLSWFDLPERIRQVTANERDPERDAPSVKLSLRRKAWLSRNLQELLRLRAALEKHQGNVTSAAMELGLPRHRARRLLAAEAELMDGG